MSGMDDLLKEAMAKTPEQLARDMLDSMELVRIVRGETIQPQSFTSGDVVELANLFAENMKLRKALGEALDGWETELRHENWCDTVEGAASLARITELRAKFLGGVPRPVTNRTRFELYDSERGVQVVDYDNNADRIELRDGETIVVQGKGEAPK
jgi:hypothetical protein